MPSIQELRERYKPKRVKYLLIAESPPESPPGELRFFYNPEQEKGDYFFRSVMEVIFPEFKDQYKKGGKGKYLERFKEAGFFMMDAVDTPVNKIPAKEKARLIKSNVDSKVSEIQKLVSKDAPIFLIKKNIFHVYYDALKDLGFNVVQDEFLPFPSTGNQYKFKDKFKTYLSMLGYEG